MEGTSLKNTIDKNQYLNLCNSISFCIYNFMKHFFTIFIFFSINTFNINAQDTLYHNVQGLGGEKYLLYEDGTFIYESYLCGFNFMSYGIYKRNLFGIKFEYDTTKCPTPYILCEKADVNYDSITIYIYNMVDKSTMFFPVIITNGSKNIKCLSDSITIPKSDLTTDSIQFTYLNQKTIFKFDTSCATLKVYLEPFGYNCGINEISKLKKRNKGYLYKFKVFDEIREKPWKKGKKRIVKHFYT